MCTEKSVLCLADPGITPDIILYICSGDVGLGLNVRRMRNEFLSLFAVTYSLRPLGESASVFRRYPGQWQVGSLCARCSKPAQITCNSCLLQYLTPSEPQHWDWHYCMQVFLEDAASPGRYNMIAERSEKPTGDQSPGNVQYHKSLPKRAL